MIEKKYIKQYDRGSPVRGALTSAEDGQPVDLTNATIKFLMMQINDDGTTSELVNADAVIESPATAGGFRYDWSDGDTDETGNHPSAFQITFHDDNNRRESFPSSGWLYIIIEPDIGNV